jgi:hypothetical protein
MGSQLFRDFQLVKEATMLVIGTFVIYIVIHRSFIEQQSILNDLHETLFFQQVQQIATSLEDGSNPDNTRSKLFQVCPGAEVFLLFVCRS